MCHGNYLSLVAWNASREAVRAVNDALPILRGAKKVEVFAVNSKVSEHEHGEIPSADICLHLARRGVNAEAHRIVAKDIEVGDSCDAFSLLKPIISIIKFGSSCRPL